MIQNVSSAWKPVSGQSYGQVEVRMQDDFRRADATMWGIVEAKGVSASFERLRIVGARNWHPRFDWMNLGPGAHPWPDALGGSQGGGVTALAGLMALDCPKLTVKRLELVGIPGAGVYFQRSGLAIETACLDRVGWPLYGHYDSLPNARISRLCSAGGHWWSKAWGSPGFGDPRTVSLRRLDATHLQRGELVLNASAYILEDYVHHGDGISFKLSGTNFLVRRCHVGAAFFNGSVPENAVQFPELPRYRHLHESRDCFCEDSEFEGNPSSAAIQPRALVYVSYPFTTPLVFRRCTFIRGPKPSPTQPGHLFAFQINWANVRFEDCDFVGWDGAAAALELSPGYNGMPPASADPSGSRFYAS